MGMQSMGSFPDLGNAVLKCSTESFTEKITDRRLIGKRIEYVELIAQA